MPKHFIAMVGNSKLHAIILCVINIKLIIGKKTTALEIMTLNCKRI